MEIIFIHIYYTMIFTKHKSNIIEMRKIKVKSNVFFKTPESQVNSTIVSRMGDKSIFKNLPIKPKLTNRSYIASSDISAPVLPPSSSQNDSLQLNKHSVFVVPPYQNPSINNTGSAKVFNGKFRYTKDKVNHATFNASANGPEGYKHFGSDYKDVPLAQGDGLIVPHSQRTENTAFVPAVDPVGNQEFLELQKVNRVKKPRYITKADMKRFEALQLHREEKERRVRDIPKNNKFRKFNNIKLLRASRRNNEVYNEKQVEIKRVRQIRE